MGCRRLEPCPAWALVGLLLAGCSVRPAPPAASPFPASVSEHVSIVHGPQHSTTVLLPVTINGQGPFTFALDTGASNSLVDATLAQRVGLPQVGPPRALQGVGGVERAVPVRVDRWSTGRIKLPALTISAAQLPSGHRGHGLEGLLGSDVWDQLGKFTLDYRSGTLTVYS
jgi:hypothetical protein